MFLYTNHHYNRHSFDYFIDAMLRNDIRDIELCAFAGYADLSDEESTKQAGQRLSDAGINVPVVSAEHGAVVPCNLALELEDVSEWSQNYITRAIENLHAICRQDIARLVISPGRQSLDRPYEEGFNRCFTALKKLSARAEEEGVELCLSCDGTDTFSNIINMSFQQKALIDAVGSRSLKAHVDYAGCRAAHENFRMVLKMLGPERIGHITLADGPGGWLLWGDGEYDADSAVKPIRDIVLKGRSCGEDIREKDISISLRLAHWQYDFEPDVYTGKLRRYAAGHMVP